MNLRLLSLGLLMGATSTFVVHDAAGANDRLASVRDTVSDPYSVYDFSHDARFHQRQCEEYLRRYVMLDRDVNSRAVVSATDEEYIERLQAVPTCLHMPLNEPVKYWIKYYTEGKGRAHIEAMLGLSLYYFPYFEEALDRYDLPLELKYLPLVESSLDDSRGNFSKAGAHGLWQFTPPTAKDCGLNVSSIVDERLDVRKSSDAAAQYLSKLYDIFREYDDWYLAVAAYNMGPGKMSEKIAIARKDNPDLEINYWNVYSYLPKETKDYVPKLIATIYAMNYYDKHNISPALAAKPIVTNTVMIDKDVHFQQIADVLGIEYGCLVLLNPEYVKDQIPGHIKPYPLILPSQYCTAYIMNEDSIIAHNSERYFRDPVKGPAAVASTGSKSGKSSGKATYTKSEKIKHKVKKGETFTSIAQHYRSQGYNVTEKQIKDARNKGKKKKKQSNYPLAGETITFTATRTVVESVPVVAEEVTDTITATHADDISVASENVVETTEEAQVVDVDEKMVDYKPVEKPVEKPKTYTVKKGDTFAKIARKHGLTLKKLQDLNPGVNANKIQAGQKIRIK